MRKHSTLLATLVLAVSLLTTAAAQAALPQSEREALISLYHATNGSAWINSESWLGAPGTECSWYGIGCNADGSAITDIALDANRLSGEIPAEVGSLRELQTLRLRDNGLTGSIPAEIGGLAKLRVLSMSGNSLGGSLPDTFSNLRSLTELSLADNQLGGRFPQWIGSLSALETLDLSGNRLSGRIPAGIGQLSNLRSLNLSDNQLNGNLPAELGALARLERFAVAGNMISGTLPASFKSLGSLKALDISFNAIGADDATVQAWADAIQPRWAETQTLAPTELTGTHISNTELTLTWRPDRFAEPGRYEVWADDGAGSALVGSTNGKSMTTLNIRGLDLSKRYSLAVRTITYPHLVTRPRGGFANAEPSDTDRSGSKVGNRNELVSGFSQSIVVGPPAAPSSLSATALSSAQILLTWTDNSGDETGFKIERRLGLAGTWTTVLTIAANQVSATDGGLVAATEYYYRMRAVRSADFSDYSNEANATTSALPAAPTSLVANPILATQMDLTWQDNSTDETAFKIERKVGAGGTWATILTLGPNVQSVTDVGLTPTTEYFYRVRAARSADLSAYSNEANATTRAVPAAPTNLVATSIAATQVNLTWVDHSSDETGFKIELNGPESANTWKTWKTVGANVTTLIIGKLSPSTSYAFRVRAVRSTDLSNYSNEATTTTFPSPPTNLVATPTFATQVRLDWVDNASDETSYKVERKLAAGGSFVTILTLPPNTITVNDVGLTPSTDYVYRVRAARTPILSHYSNEATLTTLALPGAPSGLIATAVSTTSIRLDWTDNSSDETSFKVERKLASGGSFTTILTLPANTTTVTNVGLPTGTEFVYRVRAARGPDFSGYTNEATAAGIPLPPTNLVATEIYATVIVLTWTDTNNSETGFKLERKLGPAGTWTTIQTLGPNVTTTNDEGLPPGTQYYYRVRSYRLTDFSAYSNEANATTLLLLPGPTGLSALATSSTTIDLTWTDNSSDETSFKVERKLASGGSFVTILTLPPNTTAVTNVGLTGGTGYVYRVRAARGPDFSTYTNEATATTP